jgi:glycosyltransferase involved in cell wall biosynthesis
VRHRLAIIATHPIQYYAPLFRLLTARANLDVHVFYGWKGAATGAELDRGFGREVHWDIPLLEGYAFTFVPNESSDPGTHHFRGIRAPTLIPLIEQWKPNALLVYGWNFQSHLSVLRSFRRRTPVLFRGDSTLIDESPGLRKWARRAVLHWVYRHIDIALFVGLHNREYFRAHGVDETQLIWAPHSVDNERFRDLSGADTRRAMQWRAGIGVPQDATVVLFAGKLEPKKAPELLLRYMLGRDPANEHLVIIGSGPMQQQLTEMAAGNPKIHFLGFQNQSAMPAAYRLADVFVLPSRGPGETWGLAVNEAMSSHRPVVVSDRVGCAPDLAKEGQTGSVFSAGDEKALDAKLRPMLDSREYRNRLGTGAASLIELWSLEEQARRIEGAVERAIAMAHGKVA